MSADIGNLRVGQAPQGIHSPVSTATPASPTMPIQQPAPPTMPVVPPATPPMIVAPSASGTGGLRKVVYVLLGLIILGGIVYSLLSLMSSSDTTPTVTESPSTSPEPSLTLGGKSLRTYLGSTTATIAITDASTATNDIRSRLASSQPTAKMATALAVTSAGAPVSAGDFLKYVMGPIPPALSTVLGSDWALLFYGQTETFDAAGMKSESGSAIPKAITVIEVSDASGANQAMRAWESTGLASASEQFLGYDVTKRIVSEFTEGVYKTIPVRYWNFPYADASVDYAIVTASNNKNYLIISASRESMFFTIDQLIR